MKRYILKLKYILAFQVLTALLSIVGIASMPYVVKLLFDYDFSKGIGGAIRIVFLYLLSIAVGMFFEYCSQRTGCRITFLFSRTMWTFFGNIWNLALPFSRLFYSCLSTHFFFFRWMSG